MGGKGIKKREEVYFLSTMSESRSPRSLASASISWIKGER